MLDNGMCLNYMKFDSVEIVIELVCSLCPFMKCKTVYITYFPFVIK